MMYINSMKGKTKSKDILSIEDSDIILLPLLEKFGSKPHPLVTVGERVKKYQLLAQSDVASPARIHAPVSGIVEKMEKMIQIDDTEAVTLFIRNDGAEKEIDEPLGSAVPDSYDAILKRIEDAGIVGLGGAQFPTARKYDRKDKKVVYFIVNGAECEPYLTADYALMKKYPREILDGILIADQILEAGNIVIAFEESNREIETFFSPLLKEDKYRKIGIKVLPDEYPQGGELQLAKTVTGIEIAKGTVPLEKGVVVSNVGTLYAVYEAVVKGKPLTERIITVSGECAGHAGNYRIKIGTPALHILRSCNIDPENALIVAGGPMMSPQVRNFSAPLYKGSLGIVALPEREPERLPCIWCGYCVDVCPMKLMPMKYDQFYRKKKYTKLDDYTINDCIECGACEYICPSKVPLIRSIKEGKVRLKEIKDADR